jgi:hypothetical protein
VIHIDLADSAKTEFWRGHNPGALAMVEGSGMKSGDPATAFICQVGGWVGAARRQAAGKRGQFPAVDNPPDGHAT